MKPKPIRLLIVTTPRWPKNPSAPAWPASTISRWSAPRRPYVARDKILDLKPDVMTLDLEMPRMDGITFLKAIMKHRPMPVIIFSSLTPANSHNALEALQAGAVDVMEKPAGCLSTHAEGVRLSEKIKAAAGARLAGIFPDVTPRRGTPPAAEARHARIFPARKIILMGSSTGGPRRSRPF